MPRKRQLDPDFWKDGEISHLKDKIKLFYLGTWNFADDHGVIPNKPQELRVQIFPYNPQVKIEKYIEELINCGKENDKNGWGKLVSYEVDKKKYLWIKNFLKHQKIDYPTYKYPISESIQQEIASIQRDLATNRESRVEKNRVELPEYKKFNPTAYKKNDKL